VRRQTTFQRGTDFFPTVIGVFVTTCRTAAFFNGAFVGPGSVMPLSADEAVDAVLAAALLADATLRRRWCQVLGLAADGPLSAAVIEADAVARLTAGDGPLDLAPLGPETAFALAYAFSGHRARWLARRCPAAAAFMTRLRPTTAAPIRC
jgi:hypothetical protein